MAVDTGEVEQLGVPGLHASKGQEQSAFPGRRVKLGCGET